MKTSDGKYIAKLLNKKANSYLKISIATFSVCLCILITMIVLLCNQYIQIKKDFVDNKNTHIIEISSKRSKEKKIEYLKFSSEDEIKHILEEKFPNAQYKIYTEYQLNFGIPDPNGNCYYIYGIEEEAAPLLGDCKLEKDTIYSYNGVGNVELQVPKIKVKENGMESTETTSYLVESKGGVIKNNTLGLYEDNTNSHFVGKKTYEKIVALAYDADWEEFVKKYNENNPYGIQAIRKIFIYSDIISDISPMARAINEEAYNTNYTFKAFDDFDKSIINTVVIISILIILIFTFTAIQLVISFKSYLRIQQKDMGILKQLKYTSKEIYDIYKININTIFYKLQGIAQLYILILGIIFIKPSNFQYVVMIMGIIGVILIGINKVVLKYILQKYCNKDILSLFKENKEFE